MRMILMIPLIIFLNGCKSAPPKLKKPLERCAPYMREVEGTDHIVGKCRCHKYEITKKNIGRVTKSTDHPLLYCNKSVSFTPGEWGRFYLFMEELRLWMIDESKR